MFRCVSDSFALSKQLERSSESGSVYVREKRIQSDNFKGLR